MGGFTADQIAAAYGLSGLYQSGDERGRADRRDPRARALRPERHRRVRASATAPRTVPTNVSIDGGAGHRARPGEAALDIENVIGAGAAGQDRGLRGPEHRQRPIRHDERDHQPAPRAGRHDVVGTVRAARGVQPGVLGEHPVPGGGGAGDDDRRPRPATTGPRTASRRRRRCRSTIPASQPFVTGVGGTSLSANPTTGARAGRDRVERRAVDRRQRRRHLELLDDAQLPEGRAGVAARDQRQLLGRAVLGAVGRLPRGARRVRGRRPGHRLRDLLERERRRRGAAGNQGWQVVGGTSAAAPAWAALIALANASARVRGRADRLRQPGSLPRRRGAYSTDFNDVTSGNNDMTGLRAGCTPPARDTTWRPGSGLRTAPRSPSRCAPTRSRSPTPARSARRSRSVSLQIKAADTRGAAVTYKATGLPSGLAINGSTGKITGRPNRLGKSTVTVAVADAAGTTAQTTFAWTIQGAPTLSHVSLSSVGVARPRLSFTVAAGRGAPSIKSVNVTLPRGLHFTSSRVDGHRHRRARASTLKFTARLVHGALVLTLRTATPQARVTDLVAAPGRQREPDVGDRPAPGEPSDAHDARDRRRQADDAPVAEDQAELIGAAPRRPPAGPVARCSAWRRRPGS